MRTNVLPVDVHLIGICGQGLTALAGLLLSTDYRVTGCDSQQLDPEHDLLHRLAQGLMIEIWHPNDPEHLTASGCGAVITASYLPDSHSEVVAAKRAGVPVLTRERALGIWLRAHTRDQIAVGGVAGKSTTTAMVGHVLQILGKSPTEYVGALNPNRGGANYAVGQGKVAAVEACEYRRAFLELPRVVAAVTNMYWGEHTDFYNSPAEMDSAFAEFLDGAEVGVLNWTDPGIRRVARTIRTPSVKVGLGKDSDADVRVTILCLSSAGSEFAIDYKDGRYFCRLPLVGVHNVLNAALAATAVATWDDSVAKEAVFEALGSVALPGRRLEVVDDTTRPVVIDDYGHHPAQIAAGVQGMRQRFPGAGRIGIFLQPSVYKRTFALIDQYIDALRDYDDVLVDDMIRGSADTDADVGLGDTESLVARLRSGGIAARRVSIRNLLDDPQAVANLDVLVCSGARRSGPVARRLAQRLRRCIDNA